MKNPEQCKRLNEAFSYVSDKYLDMVELERKAKAGGKRNRKPLWAAIGPVAACICALLLPLGVLAAKWFNLRDLILPKEDDNISHEIDISHEITTPVSDTAEISLSGYMDSPEAQALAEWRSFLEGYDTDHEILNQIGNEPIDGRREDWDFYGIYTHEMEEKLDEITDKYGLKLHTDMDVIDQDELMDRVGGFFMDKEYLTWAYMYEDGYFHVEGDVKLSESLTAAIQLTRCVKGTFNDVIISVEEIEQYTQWQYLSSCGESILLALDSYNALIFADFEDCFVSVNVLCGSESGMTKEGLQELADTIDFSILKDVQIPEMRGDSVVSSTDEPPFLELQHGELGNLGIGILVYTVPCDDKQDYKLCFYADESGKRQDAAIDIKELKIEDADYVFPDAREGNMPIGTFQTFDEFQIEDIGEDGTWDILLVGIYGIEEELSRDIRVYTENGEGYTLNMELTKELSEKYANEGQF